MAWCRQATSHYLYSAEVSVDLDLCHHMASLDHNELNYQPESNIKIFFQGNAFENVCSKMLDIDGLVQERCNSIANTL